MNRPLKKGYTTGVHASFAFWSALSIFLASNKTTISKTKKMDNDDLDVTKGAEIVVTISNSKKDLKLNPTPHKPYILGNLKLFAGRGVGVVTKEGLKPPKGYPAINPTPLETIEKIYKKFGKKREIFASIGVTNGEEISKETANLKVGVVGGISILGTTGFVKPISARAYLDSIKTQIEFAYKNGFREVIFTLGNSSFEFAKKNYKIEQIIEIGNFIYDSFNIAKEVEFNRITLICGIGKAIKVTQGFKNTHNRFGSIDFNLLKSLIEKELNIKIKEDIKTAKRAVEIIKESSKIKLNQFYLLIEILTKKQLKKWFEKKDIDFRVVINRS